MAYQAWQPGMKMTATRLNDMVGTWQDYTPTWTAESGTTTVGNGTLDGRYRIVGTSCDFAIRLDWGSTTTQSDSTGNWSFALPVDPYAGNGTTWQPVDLWIYDTSNGSSEPTRWHGNAYINATDSVVNTLTAHAKGVFMDKSTMPGWHAADDSTTSIEPGDLTWATGDRLNIYGSYEIAT